MSVNNQVWALIYQLCLIKKEGGDKKFCNTITFNNHRSLIRPTILISMYVFFFNLRGHILYKKYYTYTLLIKDISFCDFRSKHVLYFKIAYVHGYKLFCNKIIFGCTFSSDYEGLYQKVTYRPNKNNMNQQETQFWRKKMAPNLFCNSTLHMKLMIRE